jgi:hypothetical protein
MCRDVVVRGLNSSDIKFGTWAKKFREGLDKIGFGCM